jgi:hypothetical protein
MNEIGDVVMQNGVPDQGYVSASNWNYFRYDSASVANLMISLQTTGGDCDIYAKSGSIPSRISYGDHLFSFSLLYYLSLALLNKFFQMRVMWVPAPTLRWPLKIQESLVGTLEFMGGLLALLPSPSMKQVIEREKNKKKKISAR